jgi:DNA-binding MltR family transcriptional regulator
VLIRQLLIMAKWRKELRELSRRDPEPGDEAHFITTALYTNESDRGCALIAGSIAENALEEIIRARLPHLSKERLDELFGYEGVLGTFSAKIKIAYAFGLIDHKLRDDFDRLREIRNVFAHARTIIRFRTPQIAQACGGLMAGYPNTPAESKIKHGRTNYIETAMAMVHAATMVFKRVQAGHVQKIRETLTFDEVATSREKSRQRFLERRPKSRPGASKKKARAAPPRSSRA